MRPVALSQLALDSAASVPTPGYVGPAAAAAPEDAAAARAEDVRSGADTLADDGAGAARAPDAAPLGPPAGSTAADADGSDSGWSGADGALASVPCGVVTRAAVPVPLSTLRLGAV